MTGIKGPTRSFGLKNLLIRQFDFEVSRFEAVVEIFHLDSDLIPGEVRGGGSSSGLAHRSGEAEVGG
jgi:hypothetical protein